MNNLDPLLQRNKEFAAQQSAEGTLMPSLPRALPNVKAIIIGCAEMRVASHAPGNAGIARRSAESAARYWVTVEAAMVKQAYASLVVKLLYGGHDRMNDYIR